MEKQFLGYLIKYNENNEVFEAYLDKAKITSSKSLKALETKLTAEKKTKYPRVKIFYSKWRDDYIEGEVTSIAESTYGSNDSVWVINSNKERSKETAKYLVLDTPDNREKIKNILQKEKQIEGIQEAINDIKSSLVKFNIKDYKPIEETENVKAKK